MPKPLTPEMTAALAESWFRALRAPDVSTGPPLSIAFDDADGTEDDSTEARVNSVISGVRNGYLSINQALEALGSPEAYKSAILETYQNHRATFRWVAVPNGEIYVPENDSEAGPQLAINQAREALLLRTITAAAAALPAPPEPARAGWGERKFRIRRDVDGGAE